MRYHAPTASWEPAEDQPAAEAPATLSLITWNVWFGAHQAAARATATLELLQAADADVICLQEVTRDFLARLLAAGWVRRDYTVSDASGATVDPYGVVVLTRLPLRALTHHEMPTSMARGLVLAELQVGAARLAVGAVHLESRRHNADVRGEQLAVILPILRAAAPDAILCGDLNFDAEWEDEERALRGDLLDLWPALRGADPGYTVDTAANPMTAWDKGHDKQVRFDRVLLRSPARTWRPRSIRLLGTAPVRDAQPPLYPSDHFGLQVVLDHRGAGAQRSA